MAERRNPNAARASVAAVAVAIGALAPGIAGQAQSGDLPRGSDGNPELSGIWQAVSSAHWNIEPHAAYAGRLPESGAIGSAPGGLGIVEGGTMPYRPEVIAKRQENFENRRTGAFRLRPKCSTRWTIGGRRTTASASPPGRKRANSTRALSMATTSGAGPSPTRSMLAPARLSDSAIAMLPVRLANSIGVKWPDDGM